MRWECNGVIIEFFNIKAANIEFDVGSDSSSSSSSSSSDSSDSDSGSDNGLFDDRESADNSMSNGNPVDDDEREWLCWCVTGGSQSSFAHVVAFVRSILMRNIRPDKLIAGNINDLVRQCYEEALLDNSLDLPLNIQGSALSNLIDKVSHKVESSES